MHSTSRAVVFVGALAALNCGKPAPPPATQAPPARSTAPVAVTVTNIDVGRSVAADKSIADRTDSFTSMDTFYVAVHTAGASPSTTLVARWTFGDQLVTESNQTIAPDGPAVTEFHASGPTGGWPKGDYKVEITSNGVSVGTKTFSVK
jgi:hypothetical protein